MFDSFVTPWTSSLQGYSVHRIFPGKNTGVGCHILLQGIFPTQGSNLCLLAWQVDALHQATMKHWVTYFWWNSRFTPECVGGSWPSWNKNSHLNTNLRYIVFKQKWPSTRDLYNLNKDSTFITKDATILKKQWQLAVRKVRPRREFWKKILFLKIIVS